MAEFHAATYHLVTNYPGGKEGLLKDYKTFYGIKPFDETMTMAFKDSFLKSMDTVAVIARDYVSEAVADKIPTFKPHSYDTWIDTLYHPKGRFNTIIHGDSWANNSMFLYDDATDKIKDYVMLDFQCCRISSPAIDLIYAIVTGTRGEVRMEKTADWLKIYHEKFTADMKSFGYDAAKVYPFEDFVKDYDDAYAYGFCWAVSHAQVGNSLNQPNLAQNLVSLFL